MESFMKQHIFFVLLLVASLLMILVGLSDPLFSGHWIVIGTIALIISIIGLIVAHSNKDNEEIRVMEEIKRMEMRASAPNENTATITSNCKYSIDGCRGRHIDIYENKAVITTKTNLGSILAGGYSNGEKTIYYRDVIGIQFKLPTFVQIGYLQFETASCQATNNFFSENSFPFESSNISNREIEKVVSYVKDQVDKIRSAPTSTPTVIQAQSPADELKKFKELLDMGVITQDEFDQKKKQLLSL